MTTIVYIVGTGSKNDNQELRWSLRSLDKHALDDVQPIIIGSIPSWFRGEGADVADPTKRKEKNIFHKIRYAIDNHFVDGEFQISADDHFWIKPTVFADIPFYFRQASIGEYKGGNNYEKAMAGTRNVLLLSGHSIINTTVHCNTWCNTADLPKMQELYDWVEKSDDKELAFAKTYGAVQWAMWPNIAIGSGRYPRRKIAFKHDVKINKDYTEKDWKGLMDVPIWSCSDDAFTTKRFVSEMTSRFGGKCRWER